MFFKRREINPYTVSDKAVFRNVDQTLTLYVRQDAFTLVTNMKKANEACARLTDESSDKEKHDAARLLAVALFGQKHADELMDFYPEPITVIAACSIYITTLAPKIAKAQKK